MKNKYNMKIIIEHRIYEDVMGVFSQFILLIIYFFAYLYTCFTINSYFLGQLMDCLVHMIVMNCDELKKKEFVVNFLLSC